MPDLLYRCPYDSDYRCGMIDPCKGCTLFELAVERGEVEIFNEDGQKIVRRIEE